MAEVAREGRVRNVGDLLLRQLGFTPWPAQKAIVECDERFILVTGGEQAGKSRLAAVHLVRKVPEVEGAGLYWLVGRNYGLTEREFEYISEDFGRLGMRKDVSKRVDPGVIELEDGTVIKTKSADDPRTLAMEAPDGIVICEASQVDYETYLRCKGRVGPKRGWMYMSGTLEGSLGWYPGLSAAWRYGTKGGERSFVLPSWTNLGLYPGGREDPEIKRIEGMASDEWFMERMGGVASPPRGAVFGQEFRPHIHVREIEWDEKRPVSLAIDPGYAGAYAVEACQIINDTVYIFDEIYERGRVTEEVIEIAMARPWWKEGMMEPGVIDVAGGQHQAMTAPTEMWLSKAGYHLSANRVLINDGIERLKAMLKPHPVTNEPRVIIAPRCGGILSELGAMPNPFDGTTAVYQWKTDREGNVVGDTPEQKNNHGLSALIYFVVEKFGYSTTSPSVRERIRVTRW